MLKIGISELIHTKFVGFFSYLLLHICPREYARGLTELKEYFNSNIFSIDIY